MSRDLLVRLAFAFLGSASFVLEFCRRHVIPFIRQLAFYGGEHDTIERSLKNLEKLVIVNPSADLLKSIGL